MRTYILIGYVILALQCAHISSSTNYEPLPFKEVGSGLEDESNQHHHPGRIDEEVSGSGWKPSPAYDDDAEDEQDDYYGYDDGEGSGVYPAPSLDTDTYTDIKDFHGTPDIGFYPPIHEDDFHIETGHPQENTDIVKKVPAEHDPHNPSLVDVPPVEQPSTTAAPPTLTDSDSGMENNIRILSQNNDDRQVSIFAQPSILAAFIGGAVMGLLCAILLVMFIVYRMRKRDEGSYPLDEPKRVPLTSSYAPNEKEIYA